MSRLFYFATALVLTTVAACGTVEDERAVTAEPTRWNTDDLDCTGADTWDNYAGAFFTDHCVHCHAHFDEHARVARKAQRMITMISSNAMPKDVPLDPNAKTRILTWLQCGAK